MPDKRVVLIHTQGAYRGLWQIVGTEAQMREGLKTELLPDLTPAHFLDHDGEASLSAVKDRYIMYREIMAPALSTFHPDQQ
jgi:hypothetical protein